MDSNEARLDFFVIHAWIRMSSVDGKIFKYLVQLS